MSHPAALPASRPKRTARWGLLATIFVMGGALIATGLIGYVGARTAADEVARARTVDLFRAVRRAMRGSEYPTAESLQELLDEFGEQGLSYVGVASPHGRVEVDAGEPEGGRDLNTRVAREAEPFAVGGRYRIEAPLAPPRPRRFHTPFNAVVVIEVTPALSESLTRAALTQLVVGCVAALALAAVAVLFWHQAARADRAEAELADKRRLAALGEMSAVLGHELRNPLASLKGHAQLVVERLDGLEEGQRALRSANRVVHEAERLERLTGQILTFARTGAVHRIAENPVETVQRAVDAVGDPRVAVSVAPGVPAEWPLDRPRLEQVLVNLLKNAVQALGEGADGASADPATGPDAAPIQVTVQVVGKALVIEVLDRGPGFLPGEEEAVFEPFRTGRVQGTGLGLAIARRIVEAHGGAIHARNRPDGGATVRVELPA